MRVLLDECLPKRLKNVFQIHNVLTENLESAKMTVVLLAVKNNRYETLKLLVPKIQKALETAQEGQLVRIET